MALIARFFSVVLAIGLVFPIGSAMAGGPPPIPTVDVNVVNTPLEVEVVPTPQTLVEPFNNLLSITVICDGNICEGQNSHTIPSGKQLTIETVSFYYATASEVDLRFGFFCGDALHYARVFRGFGGGDILYLSIEPIKCRISPGSDYRCSILSDDVTVLGGHCSVSGYYEVAPE
jgi:hypothetical protein